MAKGSSIRKEFVFAVLLLNFLIYGTILGLAGFLFNKSLDDNEAVAVGNFPGGSQGQASGNAATPYLVFLALIAGVVGMGSILSGFLFYHKGASANGSSTPATAALIAFTLVLLAFGVACKEFALKHSRDNIITSLESLSVAVVATHFVYLLFVFRIIH